MKIDLGVKKTEAEWQKTFDQFWLNATPKWFEWLGWIIILGIFTFLYKTQKSKLIGFITIFSYFALFFYLQGLFYSLDFYGFPLAKSERARRIISLIVSGLLSWGTWVFLYRIISEISGKV